MSKLIAIDGVDASGKQTHTEMLCKKLSEAGYRVKRLSFPNYESDSSALVKMYLSGDFGENPDDVNAYAASSFFAADRFASYRTDWKNDYLNDEVIIIADRYVSSNMIHQASKIDDAQEKDDFLKWLYELEFEIYQIPKPDVTFFLDMPVEYAKKLMSERENKFDKTATKDIHERNSDYLTKSYNNACEVAEKFNWQRVFCVKNDAIRSIDEINDEMYSILEEKIL